MRTEWAWRRTVIDEWMQQAAATQPPVETGNETGTSNAAQVLEQSIQTLWQHMDALTQANSQAPSGFQWPGQMPEQPLVPFARLHPSDVRQLDAEQRAGVVLDRMQGAVATPIDPRTGSGFFFPGLMLQQPLPADAKHAVRWKAERQTRITRTGQIVYRLKLNIEVAGRPVEITFLSAKPSLSIHIKTADQHVRRRVAQPDEGILSTLRQLGWHVDNWSTSDFTQDSGSGRDVVK